MLRDRKAWCAAVHGDTKSWTKLSDWTKTIIIRFRAHPNMVKNMLAMQETHWSLGWEDPLDKRMATHSSILVWRIPRTSEAGGLQSMVSQRVRHNWATNTHTHTHTHTRTHKCTVFSSYLDYVYKYFISRWGYLPRLQELGHGHTIFLGGGVAEFSPLQCLISSCVSNDMVCCSKLCYAISLKVSLLKAYHDLHHNASLYPLYLSCPLWFSWAQF